MIEHARPVERSISPRRVCVAQHRETSYEDQLMPWRYNPHVGGKKIPPQVQKRTRARMLAHAAKTYAGRYNRIDLRFGGALCYVDAYRDSSPHPTHLVRLRYFGDEERWTLAFYTYSHEKYEPTCFADGTGHGTPEDALDIGPAVCRECRLHCGDARPSARTAARRSCVAPSAMRRAESTRSAGACAARALLVAVRFAWSASRPARCATPTRDPTRARNLDGARRNNDRLQALIDRHGGCIVRSPSRERHCLRAALTRWFFGGMARRWALQETCVSRKPRHVHQAII